jgi:hypothetical protein
MLDLNELRKIADEAIAAIKEIEDLREFSSWLKGCGCTFTQIKSFCEERDRLLMEKI